MDLCREDCEVCFQVLPAQICHIQAAKSALSLKIMLSQTRAYKFLEHRSA